MDFRCHYRNKFFRRSDGLAGSLRPYLYDVAVVALYCDRLSLLAVDHTVGVAVGYLKYNKPPVRIYKAMQARYGYVLGIIALDGAFKQATVLSLFVPILALGVPIFDNLFIVAKRLLNGKPFYKADRSQVHYRLLSAGLSPKQVVMFLCLINICMSLTSIIILLLKV